jgi:hypothetical protein
MTRKDYTMIASAIASAHLSELQLENLIRNLCKGFREDNERFDAMRFAEACRNDPYHSNR